MTTDIDIQNRLGTLDSVLNRIENRVSLLRAALPVDDSELQADARSAVEIVDGVRAAVHQLAEAGRAEAPHWATREQLIALVMKLKESALAVTGLERRVAKLRTVAEGIEAGQVFSKVRRVQTAYEEVQLGACKELYEAARDPAGVSLPGPEDFLAWLEWAAANEQALKEAGLPETSEFSGILPDGFIPSAPTGCATDDEESGNDTPLPAVTSPPTPLETGEGVATAPPTGGRGDGAPDEGREQETSEVSAPVSGDEETPNATALTDRAQLTEPASAEEAGSDPDTGSEVVLDESIRQSRTPADRGVEETSSDSGQESTAVTGGAAAAGDDQADEVPLRNGRGGPAPSAWPDELVSFKSFEERFWISPSGQTEPAPWIEAGQFGDRLMARLGECLGCDPPRLWEASILAAAAREVGTKDCPEPLLVEVLSEAWSRPATAPAALDRLPKLDFSQAATGGSVAPETRWRLRILCEAIAPSPEKTACWVGQELVDAAGFRNPALRAALVQLLKAAGEGDPITMLRHAEPSGSTPQETPAILRQKLAAARSEFHTFVTKNWSACGGTIERTHCRVAWTKFIERVQARLGDLYPEERGGRGDWDVRAMAAFVEGLPAVHAEIADAGNAALKDRKRMDRTVERLRDLATTINEHQRHLQDSMRVNDHPKHAGSPDDDLRRVMTSPVPDGEEGFCVRLLRRVAAARPGERATAGPLVLTTESIREYPGLLAALRRGPSLSAAGDDAVSLQTLEASRVAAAVLLDGPRVAEGKSSEVQDDLRAALLSLVREPLRTRIPGLLSDDERKRNEARWLEEVEKRIELGERTWISLAAGGVTAKKEVRAALDDAHARSKESGSRPLDPGLFLEWLDRVLTASAQVLSSKKQGIREEAQHLDEETRDAVFAALDEGRVGSAVRLLAGGDASATAEIHGRESLWRPDAVRRFPDPVGALRKHQEATSTLRPVLSRWLSGVQGKEQHDKFLRTEIDAGLLKPLGLKTNPSMGALRIPGSSLKEWFRRGQHNPACVPQISEIILTTPKVGVRDRSFAQKAADLAAELQAGGERLVGVLAPRLEAETRRETLSEFRRRKLFAAAIDDLDFCRIVTPGSRAINSGFALLEILLEQQVPSVVSPFLVPEGQNVQMEMYFGRRREARDLVMSPRYSRLFSGRKLGKSALLKYVEATYDGERLPSGNVLRVVYVSAVGVDSEAGLVQKIVEGLRSTLRWTDASTATATAPDPSSRLEGLLRNFARQHERESLLIVLDEADVFIEHQLDAYQTTLEKCLSFRMRSQMEADKDAMGLPRVRFVFAGYRVANTTEGAWANWGDVLRLAPLDPEDATALIARPLARVGIDATAQARVIAHRCGYQPAVLLRFGERLVRNVERTSRVLDRTRSAVIVGEDDVILTMEDPAVQEEIRTVVQNNFQGNRIASVVFSTLLREFLDFAPGHAISEPEEVVLERLREYSDGDLKWLSPHSRGAGAEVARILKDLVERQLLAERRDAKGRSRSLLMRFPHHLPVLETLAREDWIRSEIEALTRDEPAQRREPGRTSFFTRRQLERLAQRDAEHVEGFRAVSIVGTHWQTYVENPIVGIPDRLGFGVNAVVDARQPDGQARLQKAGRRLVVTGSTPEDVERICAGVGPRGYVPLFCGGVDLLRWAVSGAVSELRVAGGSPALLDLPVGLGRLGRAAIAWWFERFRGLNFPDPSATEEIALRTGGIPILVRELDEHLVGRDGEGGGVNITAERWRRVLEAFEESMGKVAARLVEGDPSTRLTPREFDLLRMAATIRRVGPMGSLNQDMLEEHWGLLYGSHLNAKALGPEDGPALRVLLGLGLLPSSGEGEGDPFEEACHLPENDVLLRLVDAAGK